MLSEKQKTSIILELKDKLTLNMLAINISIVVLSVLFLYNLPTMYPSVRDIVTDDTKKDLYVIMYITVCAIVCYSPFAKYYSKKSDLRMYEDMNSFSYDEIRKRLGLSYDKNNVSKPVSEYTLPRPRINREK